MVGSAFQVIAKTGDSQQSETAFLPPLICSLPWCKTVNSMAETFRFWHLGKMLICITTELWKGGLWMGWDGQSYCSRLLVDPSRMLAYISALDYWSYLLKEKGKHAGVDYGAPVYRLWLSMANSICPEHWNTLDATSTLLLQFSPNYYLLRPLSQTEFSVSRPQGVTVEKIMLARMKVFSGISPVFLRGEIHLRRQSS